MTESLPNELLNSQVTLRTPRGQQVTESASSSPEFPSHGNSSRRSHTEHDSAIALLTEINEMPLFKEDEDESDKL